MTVTTNKKTGPEAAAPGITAAKALHAKYVAAGDEKSAKLVAQVSNLFHNISFTAAKEDEPATVNSAEIDGSEVDLRGMEPDDAEAYAAYASEMDGSAALARHIADLEARDEEDRRLGIGAHNDGS